MAELVDAHVSGACAERREGSSPFLGNWSFDHELNVGELIVFEDMIHYTTVKTTMFNGIHHPALGLWTTDNNAVIYKEFKYEDYRDRMC